MYLSGTYERNLDAKGRLSLPAAIREEFGEVSKVKVLPALEVDALYVFPNDAFENYVKGLFEKRGGYDNRRRGDQDLKRRLNSRAVPVEIDSAQRIGLSESLRATKDIAREVVVVGNDDHLEIWGKAAWDKTQAEQTDEDLVGIFFA